MNMTLYETVKKLTGPVRPVGESHTDDARFDNLEEMIDLVDKLVADILAVAGSRDCVEWSRAKAGKRAKEFLDELSSSIS